MRFRLVHKLTFTLLAFTGVAVLALGGLTAWQLRNGFGEYLAASDVRHFERFVQIVESRMASAGGAADLLAGHMEMSSLLEELDLQSTFPLSPPGPPRISSPPGGNPLAFPDRIQLLTPKGTVLLGSRYLDAMGGIPLEERPIHLNGRVIALARMQPSKVVHTGAEARFLQDQYTLIVAGSLGLTILALFTGAWLARRWSQPLSAVKYATQRLAEGELSVRLVGGPDLAGRGDEIGDVVRNVNRMAEGLQQLESARRRWLADISHELRTPLTVLCGDIEALYDGVRPLGPEAIGILRSDVLRLNRLVDDLHLLAVSDLQSLPCQIAEDDAIAMMRRVYGRHLARDSAAHLSFQLQLPDDAPLIRVRWDTGRIEQLLDNLLENSLRYTSAPGEIRMCLVHTDGAISIIVEDSAPGLTADQLSRLFVPFYRGEIAHDGSSEGSGLGLAICQAIAKAHGGELSATSSVLGGLRITLFMPQPAGLQQPRSAGRIV